MLMTLSGDVIIVATLSFTNIPGGAAQHEKVSPKKDGGF